MCVFSLFIVSVELSLSFPYVFDEYTVDSVRVPADSVSGTLYSSIASPSFGLNTLLFLESFSVRPSILNPNCPPVMSTPPLVTCAMSFSVSPGFTVLAPVSKLMYFPVFISPLFAVDFLFNVLFM